jgi:hypothetical protein
MLILRRTRPARIDCRLTPPPRPAHRPANKSKKRQKNFKGRIS